MRVGGGGLISFAQLRELGDPFAIIKDLGGGCHYPGFFKARPFGLKLQSYEVFAFSLQPSFRARNPDLPRVTGSTSNLAAATALLAAVLPPAIPAEFNPGGIQG
jgi:hypothetical protein